MPMKNITFTADEKIIQLARKKALQEKKTLNQAFQEWLARYTATNQPSQNYIKLMQKLQYANPTKHFSREELNER